MIRYAITTNETFTEKEVEVFEGDRTGWIICRWNGEQWIVTRTIF